jgi:Fe-S cluster biogenesis protein NfuA
MRPNKLLKTSVSLLSKSRPAKAAPICLRPSVAATRSAHSSARIPAVSSSLRPRLHSGRAGKGAHAPWAIFANNVQQRRTIFIQTESTPNADALKFLPNHPVLPEGVSTPFVEYLSPRATIAPPYPSPLAAQLMNIDGVTAVFYGADFITVTKSADANWAHVRPEVFALITEAITSGQPIVNVSTDNGSDGQEPAEVDSLSYNENDSEVVGMIKELLETRIRPAIQEDGGDIEFRGFEDGYVMLKLRGACRTCDSSTVTLKNGIEGMLMHYVSYFPVLARLLSLSPDIFWFWSPMGRVANTLQIEEVKGVTQIMDQEEEIAIQEFAKFEEKLKERRGEGVAPSTSGKESLDTVTT